MTTRPRARCIVVVNDALEHDAGFDGGGSIRDEILICLATRIAAELVDDPHATIRLLWSLTLEPGEA